MANLARKRRLEIESQHPGAVVIRRPRNGVHFALDDTQRIAFLCSAETGTSGTLFCAGDFSSSKALENGDTLGSHLHDQRGRRRRISEARSEP